MRIVITLCKAVGWSRADALSIPLEELNEWIEAAKRVLKA